MNNNPYDQNTQIDVQQPQYMQQSQYNQQYMQQYNQQQYVQQYQQPQQQYYQQPQYVAQQTQQPAGNGGILSIIGMIIGFVGIILTFVCFSKVDAVDSYYYYYSDTFTESFVFVFISLIVVIAGLVLSSMGRNKSTGAMRGMGTAGKTVNVLNIVFIAIPFTIFLIEMIDRM